MAMGKGTKLTVLFLLLAALAAGGFVTYVIEEEKVQFRRNAALVGYRPDPDAKSRILVAYFSRSGNTELMALEIAKRYGAQVVHLEAADYRVGLKGWLNALKDSRNQQAVITPEKVDLAPYDFVFIGSPIWWYSPAPPVWQFVSQNDLTGKRVVLFNTFNSRFEPEDIDAFKARVEARNGRFAGHVHVKRGRMTRQISPREMLARTRRALDAWALTAGPVPGAKSRGR